MSDYVMINDMVTEADCLEALQRAAEQLGESPTKAQYEELGLTPASATIIRTCGGWNEAKTKANLEISYSRGSRVGPEPEEVELPDGMNWEDLTVDQRWHYRNVEWNTERTLRRRSRLRSWLNEQKRERGCVRCGVSNVACLDFHHTDPASKTMAVGRMITHGYGKDALRDEIETCEVLCANCHREEHYQPPKCGCRRWVHNRKRMDGCERCSESDPACLDYHHTATRKNASVAELLSDGRSKQRVRTEIERCHVLCANCHRTEHFDPPME